jgi:hypothetical protein
MDLYGYAGMFQPNVPAQFRRAAVTVVPKAPRGTTWFPEKRVVVAPKMPRGWVGFPSAGPIVGLEAWSGGDGSIGSALSDPLGFAHEHPIVALAVVTGGVLLFLRLRRK